MHHVHHLCSRTRITDCHECYWITQSLLPSGGLRSLRASIACAWFFGTKGAAAHFISGDAYPYNGDDQKDGRGTKSGVVIASLAATLKRKTEMMSMIALIVVLIMPLGMILWWIPRCDAIGIQNGKIVPSA